MRPQPRDDYFDYTPYETPPYVPPYQDAPIMSGGGDVQYFSDPYVDKVTGKVGGLPDTGHEPRVSRVGASYSIQPRADLRPGIPAGSLFSSRGYGRGPSFLSRVPYQRGFSVELQDQLRRRRRRGLFL